VAVRRDVLVAVVLLIFVVATHGWEYVGLGSHRDAQRYFYAMQGWSGTVIALALLWYCRRLDPVSRALVYAACVWQGVQESLVGACGTSLLLSGRPYQERGALCYYVGGWDWWVILVCVALWTIAWTSRN
jgi:hypothetical protein